MTKLAYLLRNFRIKWSKTMTSVQLYGTKLYPMLSHGSLERQRMKWKLLTRMTRAMMMKRKTTRMMMRMRKMRKMKKRGKPGRSNLLLPSSEQGKRLLEDGKLSVLQSASSNSANIKSVGFHCAIMEFCSHPMNDFVPFLIMVFHVP